MHPDGERTLIADNPVRGDNIAMLKVVHRDGRVESLGYGGSWGAVWAPDGETVWACAGATANRANSASARNVNTWAPMR